MSSHAVAGRTMEQRQMTTDVAPRYGRISEAQKRYASSRSGIYRLAADHPGLLVKMGASTLVNYEVLDRIYAGLPAAQVKQPRNAAEKKESRRR
jgi:hypothetical protein